MKRLSVHLGAIVAIGVSLWLGMGRPLSTQAGPYGYWVPPASCVSSVSANSTGTNGQTTTGASAVPVVQASTSASGTNTHKYLCNLAPPQWLPTTGSRISIQDAVFVYSSTNTTDLGTQAAVLASGTFNGSLVFSYIAYPTAGANEAASAVTPVRADSGSLVITPTAASFNVSSTLAGRFVTVKFQPASPILWNTDMRQLLLTVVLQNAATTATITSSPGVLVHILSQ